ncbi:MULTISPECIES: glutamate 5-kinase [unclassified Helicobacter]|uniref:glutamate 5-kinase n=1 Tax=unclassified Helicobacter TaxID=2593540 RepID=UPI000CF1AF9A|nr:MULTISPECIES: glutamate 5-kinase [unclassified Helicobacter]
MKKTKCIIDSKRIIIKIGTTSLTYENGNLNLSRIQKLVWVLSDLVNSGKEVILVTSGAIGVGRSKLGYLSKPKTTQEKQACASVGQVILMNIYSKFFGEYGYSIGQILLTKDVIQDEYRKQNVRNTFETLINNKIIPVVNENDSVSIDEIENISRFGDNDSLAAVVSIITQADLLIILSDIDGLYDKNPRVHKDAKKIGIVVEITDEILQYAQGVGSDFGTGGMHTKLLAARTLMDSNCSVVLASGENPEIILDILNEKEVGTIFVAKDKIC